MPLTNIDSPPRNDNRVLKQWSADAIGIGATLTGDVIDVEGFATAWVAIVVTQTWTATFQVSFDGTTFFSVNAGGLIATTPAFTGGVANTGKAELIPLAGARFIQITVTNTSGSAGTATGFICLDAEHA